MGKVGALPSPSPSVRARAEGCPRPRSAASTSPPLPSALFRPLSKDRRKKFVHKEHRAKNCSHLGKRLSPPLSPRPRTPSAKNRALPSALALGPQKHLPSPSPQPSNPSPRGEGAHLCKGHISYISGHTHGHNFHITYYVISGHDNRVCLAQAN